MPLVTKWAVICFLKANNGTADKRNKRALHIRRNSNRISAGRGALERNPEWNPFHCTIGSFNENSQSLRQAVG